MHPRKKLEDDHENHLSELAGDRNGINGSGAKSQRAGFQHARSWLSLRYWLHPAGVGDYLLAGIDQSIYVILPAGSSMLKV